MNSPRLLLTTLVLALAACGDDESNEMSNDGATVADAASSQPDRDASRADSSTATPRDAAVDASPSLDAGPALVDAAEGGAADANPAETSPELARALDPAGINADERRLELVLAALCRREVRCAAYEQVNVCVEEMTLASSVFILSSNPPCADALLDQYACHAQSSCDADNPCVEGLEPAMRLCSDPIAPSGQQP